MHPLVQRVAKDIVNGPAVELPSAKFDRWTGELAEVASAEREAVGGDLVALAVKCLRTDAVACDGLATQLCELAAILLGGREHVSERLASSGYVPADRSALQKSLGGASAPMSAPRLQPTTPKLPQRKPKKGIPRK